mmetsp:Transcript_25083/g.63045  ORF Transcript_25083/g.63045 Transcript_25083/m.63045 type:complete len:420 (-) Transcript_25083:239-1498(-)
MQRVFVVGVGIRKFEKADGGPDYPEMAKDAMVAALSDCKIPFGAVKAAVAGYCYGEPTCGQRVVYELGLTGIPVVNVNNNCSTGSTALFVARDFVRGGMYDCVMAVGFEKMKGGLNQRYTDAGYTSPVDRHFEMIPPSNKADSLAGLNLMTAGVIRMFGDAASEHMRRFGTTREHFAKIAHKNHKHSVHNPYAAWQREVPYDVILKARPLYGPLSLLMACPTGDGAAAAIVCSERFVRAYNLEAQAIEILGQSMVTDLPSTFEKGSTSIFSLCGFDMTAKAAKQALEEAHLTPADVDVLEVHDCFASNELMICEAVGLCALGEGKNLIDSGVWVRNRAGGELFQIGGKWVVNPSGGLESKGHPIGATGIAQCAELCWQLRGAAQKRQVEGARVALQQNFGLGSAAVVTVYAKPQLASAL